MPCSGCSFTVKAWKSQIQPTCEHCRGRTSTRHRCPASPEAKPSAASMDIVERVLSIAQVIHSQFEHVKCCKHQCQRLVERIQILLEPVRILQAQPWWHISHHEEQMLKKLLQALEEAQKLVTKYSQASWIQKFLSARSSGEEFVWVNESLEDVAQGLSLLLQAEQKQAFLAAFQSKTCRRQDAEDLRDDRAFLDQVIASKCAFGIISLRHELGSPPQPSFGPMASAGQSPKALESRRKTDSTFLPPISMPVLCQVPKSLEMGPGRSTWTGSAWRTRWTGCKAS